jgi:hypothetical protein
MDVARYLYLDLTGQRLPPGTPVEGRKWVVEDWDLESSLDYRREGALSLAEWLGSFAGVEEGAWFAWDDWAPARTVGASVLRRARRRLGPGTVSFPEPRTAGREPGR